MKYLSTVRLSGSRPHSGIALRITVWLVCLSVLLAVGCKSKRVDIQLDLDDIIVAKGKWQDLSRSEFLQVTEKTVKHYQYTDATCLKLADLSHAEAEKSFTKMEITLNGKHFSYIPKGHTESSRRTFTEARSTPTTCREAAEVDRFDPLLSFEHFWHGFNRHYAFFESQDNLWQLLYDRYKPQVNAATGRDQLAQIFEKMLVPFDDRHIYLQTARQRFNAEKWLGFAKKGRPNTTTDNDLAAIREALKGFSISHDATLVSNYLSAPLSGESGSSVVWSELAADVGYLKINSVAAIGVSANTPVSVDTRLEAMDKLFDEVLLSLQHQRSLVLDLRFLSDVDEELGQRLLSYFAPPEGIHYRTRTQSVGQLSPFEEIQIAADDVIKYTGDLVLIVGPDTAGFAEHIAVILRQQRGAQLVGENTRGLMSSPLSWTLPGNWELGIPSRVFYGQSQASLQGIGARPDWPIPVDSFFGMLVGIDAALDQVQALLQFSPSITRQDLNTQIPSLLAAVGIPGMSAAAIKQSGRIETYQYGLADIENNRAVTEETPFVVASISKVFVGTAITQLLEAGLIELDTSINSLGLLGGIDNPLALQIPITIGHLVSHSSGIADNNQLELCNYYTVDGAASVYNLLLEDKLCPEPVQSDITTFLSAYLRPSGVLYQDENFIAAPGQQRHYSNFATALTSLVVPAATGESFTDWTERHIFEKLAMTASGWQTFDNQPDSESPRAVRYWLSEDLGKVRLPEYSEPTWPAGMLQASAKDLARFILAFEQDRKRETAGEQQLLSAQWANKMLQSQNNLSFVLGDQGIFWFVDPVFYGHTGGDFGVASYMLYDHLHETGFITLFNGSEGEQSPQYLHVIRRINWLIYRNAID